MTSDEPCPSDDGDPHGSEPATAPPQPVGQSGQRGRERVLGRGPEADDDAGPPRARSVPVAAEPVHHDPVGGQRGDDLGLGRAVLREVHDGVQAGGDAPDADRRHGAQRGHELVPPSPVAQPVAADVPVQPSGVDELGQRGLLDDARLPVGQLLGRRHRLHQVGRQDHPPEAEPGRQALAGRADVDDVVGVHALERADGLAVVPVLTVVVVLDHDAAVMAGPVDEGRTAVGRQRGAGRVLVRGCEKDGRDVTPARTARRPGADEGRGVGAVLVDVEEADGQLGAGRHRPVGVHARVLHRHDRRPLAAKGRGQERQRLHEPTADHEPVGVGPHPAGPGEVSGEGLARRQQPAGIAVAEVGVGQRAQALAHGRQPLMAGERRHVRAARAEVVSHLHRRGPGRGATVGPIVTRPRDDGARTLPGREPALGHELVVGLGHRATGDAEVPGQHPARRDARARRQAAVADRPAQSLLDGGAPATRPDLEVEVGPTRSRRGSGPVSLHRTGPYS